MLRLIGRFPKRMISGYMSSDSEAKVEPRLKGVIVKSLPQNVSFEQLESELRKNFNASNIDIKKDARGKPAYAVVNLEKFSPVKEAMKLNRTPFFDRKMFLSVIFT